MKLLTYRQLLVLLTGLLLPAAVNALEYYCMMEPHRTVEVKSSVNGRIEAIYVERSDLITSGQPLVVFESKVEKATVELARAKAEMTAEYNSSKVNQRFALRKLGRFDGLAEEGVVAVQIKDEVETEAALARLQLLQARENKRLAELELDRALAVLSQHTVLSPLTGVVVERLKSPGDYAEDGAIIKVAQLDPLNIEVLLPASKFGTIKPGMKARVTPELGVAGNYSAEVKIVDRVVDASSGMFGVRLELPNPDNKLPGGLKCSLNFDSDDKPRVSGNSPVIGTARFGLARK